MRVRFNKNSENSKVDIAIHFRVVPRPDPKARRPLWTRSRRKSSSTPRRLPAMAETPAESTRQHAHTLQHLISTDGTS